MKGSLLGVLLFLASFLTVYAQDFEFAQLNPEELDLKKYAADTTANAVVLREFGTARISNGFRTPLIFDYHVRIKIFNSKGFDQGDVIIPVYKTDNDQFESVSKIKAVTISQDQNGNVVRTPLDDRKVFKENKNKHWDHVKFAMPNMRDGCIIEYSYQLESPYVFNFRNWVFQWDIPKMYSEYIARIPAVYNYNVALKGSQPLTTNKAELEKECFTPGGGVKADCSKLFYVMENIPALVEEDYMTASSNFRSAITFELSDYVDYTGVKRKVTQEWKDIDLELKREALFGSQIKKTDLFKERLEPVLRGTTDELSKAKAVYGYIQKWFKWNNSRHFYSEDGIKKALEKHSGNVADINLSLLAALGAAGVDADAVLLSTRENGIINKLYPVLSDFNYVVAKVNIGDKSYLLDATDPLLPFGLLPIRCINDQGRVVSLSKPSYWTDLKASQKESKVYSLNLILAETGKIKGTITGYSMGYEAYNKRSAIKKFTSLEEYVENLDEKMPRIKILGFDLKNVDSLDHSLVETYEVEIDAYDNLDKEQFSFNPYFMDPIQENPFKLNSRSYPVDWGAPSDTRVSVVLNYPDTFELASKPGNVGLALPDGGGRYMASMEQANNQLTLSQMTQLNKSIYLAHEYPALKELFNRIVQTQKAEVIFRKK
ncbi:DUF3857 domain-containing protein [Arcticibacter sp.]|uniref:DUF3857 domain-containing protein n=1 Tax=Arcticibacter sp. TaxID=1872630 RepID=UPI00388EA8DB